MKDVSDIAAAALVGEPPAAEKVRLEFRREPKHRSARRVMAALSHALARRNLHWDYADEIARRLQLSAGGGPLEDLLPHQIAVVLSKVNKVRMWQRGAVK